MTYSQKAYDLAHRVYAGPLPTYSDAEQWLIQDLNETFEGWSNPLIQLIHNEWYECILYYLGEQWIQFDRSVGTYSRTAKEEWVPTPVDNHIDTAVEVAVSNMLSAKYMPTVRPNSQTTHDVLAARTGEQLLVNLDSETLIDYEKDWAYLWSTICGTGFLLVEPLKSPSRVLNVPTKANRPSNALVDDEVDVGYEYETRADAYLACRHLNPFMVRLDELATDLIADASRCRWWGWCEIRHLDWIRQNFGTKGWYVQQESVEATPIRYQAKLAELISSASSRSYIGATGSRGEWYAKLNKHAVVKHKQWAPTAEYPRGRYVIVANNILLYDGPLPLSHPSGVAEFSAVDFHYRRVPGRFWSKGVVKDILSPQDRINGIDAQVVYNRKTCINPQKLIPAGSGIAVGSWTGEPGREVRWDPTATMGFKPELLRGEPLPPQIWNERVGMSEAVKDRSGSKDILTGEAPRGVRAGIALDMLEEKAASRHFHRDNRMKISLQRAYRLRLIGAWLHFDLPKTLKYVGEHNTYEVKQFLGADLRGNVDVILESDSGIARTAAGRTYMLMQSAQSGLIDVQDPVERAEMLRRLGLHGFRTRVTQDVERAMRENEQLVDGDEVVFENQSVFELDDHHIHIAVHTNRMKYSDFYGLPVQVQENMVSHVAAHIREVVKIQQAQSEVEMPPGQGPPGPQPKGGTVGEMSRM